MQIKKEEELSLTELYSFMLRSTQLAISVGVQLDVIKEYLFNAGIMDKDDFVDQVNARGGEIIKGIEELTSKFEESTSPDAKT